MTKTVLNLASITEVHDRQQLFIHRILKRKSPNGQQCGLPPAAHSDSMLEKQMAVIERERWLIDVFVTHGELADIRSQWMTEQFINLTKAVREYTPYDPMTPEFIGHLLTGYVKRPFTTVPRGLLALLDEINYLSDIITGLSICNDAEICVLHAKYLGDSYTFIPTNGINRVLDKVNVLKTLRTAILLLDTLIDVELKQGIDLGCLHMPYSEGAIIECTLVMDALVKSLQPTNLPTFLIDVYNTQFNNIVPFGSSNPTLHTFSDLDTESLIANIEAMSTDSNYSQLKTLYMGITALTDSLQMPANHKLSVRLGLDL